MMKRALVTGGAGFIGGHLTERLVREGWRVRVLDNLSSGFRSNLASLGEEIEWVQGDIRDTELTQRACRGVDTVFHLAAIASVASSVADPLTSHEVNINGTLNMLIAARDQAVRRFVFASSAGVYGNADQVPTTEAVPIQPQSPYATGKATGELYCRNFWELYGLETVILRIFNVFGPRQSPVSGYAAVIPMFVEAAVAGRTPIVYGDGEQTRDFVYVENIVSANVRAAMAERAPGGTFNIGCGEGISLLELLGQLEDLSGRPLRPEHRTARPGEVRHSRADISRATEILGYRPEVSLREGLRRTLAASLESVPAGRVLATVA